MNIHPAANIFPVMSEESFSALRTDIAVNGQRDPIWVTADRKIIDGRHRKRACDELRIKCKERGWGGPEDGIVAFVISTNLHRRHLSESQRAMIAAKLANLDQGRPANNPANLPVLTQLDAAELFNVSERSVREAKHIRESDPELADKVERGELTLHAASRQVDEREHKEALTRPAAIAVVGLYRGDFREFAKSIPDESVELVFTDPPYDRDSLELYASAAEEAARILKPGGSMICYVGQVLLPQALPAMTEYLRYWWTCACVHSGPEQLLQKLGIRCGWKPLMWFVKGTRGDVAEIVRDTVSGAREKDAHEWQQAESEAAYFIEKLCSPGGTVVDFFVGGGTTCVAAERLGRKWVGFESDARHHDAAASRILKLREAA